MSAPSLIAIATNRRTAAFERRVEKVLAVHVPIEAPVVVACSGGPDSLATLVAVARTRAAGTVTAAHFDHRLRPAAEVAPERGLVEAVASSVGAVFLGGRAPRVPTDRGESAAREARYRWLARVCTRVGARFCLTGHHLDDQAETVLLRLARGTGLRGAAGMSARADWPIPAQGTRALSLVRPLLAISRAEIEGYLDALGLEPACDSSNDALDYARNRVRQRVLPELRQINRTAAAQIAAFANRARDDDDALEVWAAQILAADARVLTAGIAIDRVALLGLPRAVASRVVRQAASRLGVALGAEQTDAAVHAARAGGRRAALGAGIEASRQGRQLLVAREGATQIGRV